MGAPAEEGHWPGDGPRRILVGIDGSEPSLRAMQTAATLAHRFGSHVLAVSVASLPDYYVVDFAGSPVATTTITEGLRRAAEDRCKQALEGAREVAKRSGVEVETRVDFGPVKEVLLEAVARYKPDLLVVGRLGLSRFKRLWIGSVSEAMVRLAECPVLVVR